jgi:predicted transcriptional regulator
VKEETELKENSESYRGLRFIVCSHVRRGLLLELLEGQKPLHDLCSELGVPAPQAAHALRELQDYHYVREEERSYALTFIGKGVALKMIDFNIMAAVLQKHENFWFEHDTSGIPDHLIGMLILLSDCTILASPLTDVFQAYRRGLALFQGAKVFKVVVTIGVPEASPFLNKLAADQVPIHLVLPEDLLRESTVRRDLAEVQRTLGKQCTLSVLKHDPKLCIAATDSVMGLALPQADGAIDISHVLLGQSKDAVTWGTALFNHYAHAAKRVSLAEFA